MTNNIMRYYASFFTHRRGVLLLAASLCFGIACLLLPMAHMPGYEFSVLAALLAAFIAWPATGCDATGTRDNDAMRMFARTMPAIITLLCIPLLVLLVRGLFAPVCSLTNGLLFFLVITVPSAVFLVSLALFIRKFFRRFQRSTYASVLLLLLLMGAVQLLSRPQMYAYNQVLGFFTAFSWEESPDVLRQLLLYRVSTIAYAGMFLLAAQTRDGRGSRPAHRFLRLGVFALCAATALVFVVFGDQLGFGTSRARLASVLTGVVETPHFVLRYAPGTFTRAEAEAVAGDHEFRLAQVVRELHVAAPDRILSYMYPDSETKRRLLGVSGADIARPWAREIHLTADSWERTLKHEITHVVAGAFGPPLFKAPALRYDGLTEGLAMTSQADYGTRSLHDWCAASLRAGTLPPLSGVLTTWGFFTHNAVLSYITCGSFCRWLIETRGIDAMKRAYRADDVAAATGEDIVTLDAGWRSRLAAIPVTPDDSLAALFLFRRPAAVHVPCARDAGGALARADALMRASRFTEAAAEYARADRIAPDRRAVSGRAVALCRAGDVATAVRYMSAMLRDSLRGVSALGLHLPLADALFARGDSIDARRHYRRCVALGLDVRSVDIASRRIAMLDAGPTGAALLALRIARIVPSTRVDTSAASEARLLRSAAASWKRDNLFRLEYAEFLLGHGTDTSACITLLGGATERQFAAECLLLKGRLEYAMNRVGDARRSFEHAAAMPAAPGYAASLLADWIDRCAWKSEQLLHR